MEKINKGFMEEIKSFDWGWMNFPKLDSNGNLLTVLKDGKETLLNEYHKNSIYQEIFIDKTYEKYSQVQEGDIVLDIGASVGPFSYSILHKNPKHIFAVEPSNSEFITLDKNIGNNSNVTLINKGITSTNGNTQSDKLFGGETHMEGITFKDFIKENNINEIDFLKTDCEGGEYDIFTIENFCWLKENLGVVIGEWHLSTPELKQKFRIFRDVFLRLFPNHKVHALNGTDIKWDLWNEHFIEYYNEVIIHINNK